MTALLVVALLAGAAAAAAAWPLVRPPRPAEPVDAQLEAREARDRALAALKELEFDHRTGKITDADYRELVGALRHDAVHALRALR